jgi:peptidoglycan/LPS O-acetylase OafA/YrhL
MNRIPTLDGWRGIAILLVLADHFVPTSEHGPIFPGLPWIGQHGVAIFFVLSGYLITRKLVEEREKTGSNSLKDFYLRRAFRLMPCAWTYLAILAAFHILQPFEAMSCLLSFRNFIAFGIRYPFTNHFWSLAIEEQFYILWPSIFLLCGFRRSRQISLFGAGTIAIVRLLMWPRIMALSGYFSFQTQIRADALLIGCATALIPQSIHIPIHIHRRLLFFSFIALIVCLFTFRRLIPLTESILIAFVLWSTASGRFPLALHMLDFSILRWVGTISYSLYMWQEMVRSFSSPKISTLLIKVIVVFVLGSCSYYGIERPMIRLGSKLRAKLHHSALPAAPILTGM